MPTYDSLLEISDETFEELERDSAVSISSISFWFRSNLGMLNTALNKEYVLNDNQSISPALDPDAKSVFKKMYEVYKYIPMKIRANMGAAGYTPVIETSSDGMRVRFQSPSDISKVWLESKMQAQKELDDLINAYKVDKVMPNQVAGDDTQGVSLYTVTTNGLYSRQVQI